MKQPLITVFTPAYNRGYILEQLFESLQLQTDKDFEWVVVDDGSSDDTMGLLARCRQRATFPMRFERKENGGKHTAVNRGVELARGEWFFIVDSDDQLAPDAIAIYRRYLESIAGDDSFAGVVGLRANHQMVPWGTLHGVPVTAVSPDAPAAERYEDADTVQYHYRGNSIGDRAEVIRTELMRRFPFPVFEGERFITEEALWLRVAQAGYRFRWFREITYISEYLQDGLTVNWAQNTHKNWRGILFVTNIGMSLKGMPIKEKLRYCIRYYRFGRGKLPLMKLIAHNANKPLSLLALPYAILSPR